MKLISVLNGGLHLKNSLQRRAQEREKASLKNPMIHKNQKFLKSALEKNASRSRRKVALRKKSYRMALKNRQARL
jgi:hypothetical protein